MKVYWHCRGCDAHGEKDISWKDVLKIKDHDRAERHVLEIIQAECKHECAAPDVGVMVDGNK